MESRDGLKFELDGEFGRQTLINESNTGQRNTKQAALSHGD